MQEESLPENVTTALTDAFPEREVEEVLFAGPSWNDLNNTVRVSFTDGESVFLKVAADGDGSRIRRECAVIGYVGTRCEIIVPTILASEISKEPPYLVTAPMREQNLAPQWSELTRAEQATVLRQIGTALADVNSQEFEQHGHIVAGDAEELSLDTESWTAILIERIGMIRELASSTRFEHYFDEVIEVVEANQERLDPAPATLVHGDPAMPNIFCSETTLGFIDWEIAHVGDPARELHRARSQLLESRSLEDNEQLVTALREGYQQRAGSLPTGLHDRVPIYDAVRFLGTIGFFDKVVESSDKSTEKVAMRVEAEMNNRLNTVQ